MAVAEIELVVIAIRRDAATGEEIARPRGDEHVAGLLPVPARVHPDRAADRPGDPDEELEARPSRCRRATGEDGERKGAARVHDGLAVVCRLRAVPRQDELVELALEHDAEAREAGVGDEQVRAAPDDEHRGSVPRYDRGHGFEVAFAADADDDGDGSAEPVGAELGDGLVPRHRTGQRRVELRGEAVEVDRVGDGARLGRHAVPSDAPPLAMRVAAGASSSHSSGTVVRSPAPRVRRMSPGRASDRAWRTTSTRRGR